MKSRMLSKTNHRRTKFIRQISKRCGNDLKRLYDERIKLDPKFSFNKMVFEIHKLLGEGKVVAASTIRNFYLRRTTPREKTIEAIQRWIDEKENVNEDDEHKNKEIYEPLLLFKTSSVTLVNFTATS